MKEETVGEVSYSILRPEYFRKIKNFDDVTAISLFLGVTDTIIETLVNEEILKEIVNLNKEEYSEYLEELGTDIEIIMYDINKEHFHKKRLFYIV